MYFTQNRVGLMDLLGAFIAFIILFFGVLFIFQAETGDVEFYSVNGHFYADRVEKVDDNCYMIYGQKNSFHRFIHRTIWWGMI